MNPQQIPQSGFIPADPRPTDYMLGGVTGIPSEDRIDNGDWTPYEPVFTPQYAPTFDTMACVTFSAINGLETELNFLLINNLLSINAVNFLNSLNFIVNGRVRISRRFTAIMSGTTSNGNTFFNVWESIRKAGLLPDAALPFGGANFDEYYNQINITDKILNAARQFLSYFDIKYEWVLINTGDGMVDTPLEKISVQDARKQAPLQMAIPYPAHHATTLMNDTEIFDQYPPYHFTFSEQYPVHYIMKGYISEKKPMIKYTFTKALALGSVSNDVLMLQKFLNSTDTPIGNYGKETNFFGTGTKAALVAFQKKWNIAPAIGYFGPTTMAKVNSFCAAPSFSKLDAWCHAIQTHEGYFPGSVSYVNNNPGNLRYASQPKAINRDSRNFAIFATYADGYQALKTMLINAATGKSQVYNPNDTLLDFYSKYAPDSDGNNSRHYAEVVANAIGVTVNTQIKTLV